MRESYKEDLANHFGLELYADGGNIMGVATTEVHAGKLLSSEITHTECRHCSCCGKAKRSIALLASDVTQPVGDDHNDVWFTDKSTDGTSAARVCL